MNDLTGIEKRFLGFVLQEEIRRLHLGFVGMKIKVKSESYFQNCKKDVSNCLAIANKLNIELPQNHIALANYVLNN